MNGLAVNVCSRRVLESVRANKKAPLRPFARLPFRFPRPALSFVVEEQRALVLSGRVHHSTRSRRIGPADSEKELSQSRGHSLYRAR